MTTHNSLLTLYFRLQLQRDYLRAHVAIPPAHHHHRVRRHIRAAYLIPGSALTAGTAVHWRVSTGSALACEHTAAVTLRVERMAKSISCGAAMGRTRQWGARPNSNEKDPERSCMHCQLGMVVCIRTVSGLGSRWDLVGFWWHLRDFQLGFEPYSFEE